MKFYCYYGGRDTQWLAEPYLTEDKNLILATAASSSERDARNLDEGEVFVGMAIERSFSPLHKFIAVTEKQYFRTQQDTGATEHAMFVWNRLREYAGLRKLEKKDLAHFCGFCNKYHVGNCNL